MVFRVREEAMNGLLAAALMVAMVLWMEWMNRRHKKDR
jgi:predicted outer membrane lipoprotein